MSSIYQNTWEPHSTQDQAFQGQPALPHPPPPYPLDDGGMPEPVPLPESPQTFPPKVGTQHQYQYSQCSGRRKGLFIGINYFGTKHQLRGCINDARGQAQFLQGYGFRYEDMVILTDDQQNPISRPTKENMLRAMRWLVEGAESHDSLFFHYSGHGGQIVDFTSDQDDVYNETIFPVDFRKNGPIANHEMYDIMVRPLPSGSRLTAIYDCCNSGGALNLPYEYGANGLLKEPNPLQEAGHDVLNAIKSYSRGDITRVIADGTSIIKALTRDNESRERIRKAKTSSADVVQLSGSKNYETSADIFGPYGSTGAMSWAFREVLIRQPDQSYHSLLVNLRGLLQTSGFQQKPVMSCSHPIDTNLRFVI